VVDSGISMSADEGVFPSQDRLTGKTISDYAAGLARDDKDAYKARFSQLIKGGFKPEDYPAQFEKTKAAITGGAKN